MVAALADSRSIDLHDEAVGMSGDPAIDCLQLTQRTWLEVFVVAILHQVRVIVPLDQKSPVVFSQGSQPHAVATQKDVVGLQ